MPPSSPSDATRKAFALLADVVYGSDGFEQVYEAVCATATQVVPGCDHVSLMLAQGSGFVTAAASDEIARSIDAAERRLGTGPCVDALAGAEVSIDADLRSHATWPRLAQWVLANTPVRGAAGYQLRVDGRRVGALNFFSDTPGALAGASADQAVVFTSFTAVALKASQEQERARSLRTRLEQDREIGKAVGLLMTMHSVDEQEALRLLDATAGELGQTLVDTASHVLRERLGRSGA